jgi:hypothetical protein
MEDVHLHTPVRQLEMREEQSDLVAVAGVEVVVEPWHIVVLPAARRLRASFRI